MPAGGRPRAAALLLAALLGLAACGGGDDDESGGGDRAAGGGDRAARGGDRPSGEEAVVAEVIDEAARSTDPADCTRLQTRRFLEQNEIEEGRAALRSCRENAGDGAGNPRRVDVAKVAVDGRRATARAAFEGGDVDGQALNLSLVKQGDQWKLDHIDSFAKFDRRRLLTAAGRAFRRPPDALPAPVARCVSRRLGDLSDAALKRLLIQPSQEVVVSLIAPCLSRAPEQGGGDPA